MQHDLPAIVVALGQQLQQRGWMLASAESCTGGLIAAACTDLAGSSTWFERGFVTYSNAAKTELLGVPANLIATHGAVSEPVVRAMAQGAAQRAGVPVAVASTGIAGPGGGSSAKPVGTVWLGWSVAGTVTSTCYHFAGDRPAVRAQAVCQSLFHLLKLISAK
ncbi:CinA family protein [Comamonas nitrativorans]|uniref:CinA family protein n=1 Tax=Comamonas nitrativorans TaxID=108437 RepID=A0ABV9GXL0_9BURK